MKGKWKIKFENVQDGEKLIVDDSNWHLIHVPSAWGHQKIHYRGIAWYRLHLKINDNFKNQKLGFVIPNILDAHKVYFNGHLIGQSGVIDPSLKNFQYNPKSNIYIIDPSWIDYNESNVISIHVQSILLVGGMLQDTYIGEYDKVQNQWINDIIIRSAMSLASIVFALYNLVIFFGTKEKSNLYMAVLFLSMGLLILTFHRIDSWIYNNFYVYYFLFSFAASCTHTFHLLFFHKEFEIPFKKVEIVLFVIYTMVALFNLFACLHYPSLLIRNQITIGIQNLLHVGFISFSGYYCIKILIQKKYSNYVYAIGYIIILPFIIDEVFIVVNIKENYKFHSMYIGLLLMLSFSINLSMKQLQLFKKIIQLKKDYSDQLEKEVLTKTRELIQTNQDLVYSNNSMNKLFSIISHDLRSPMDALNGLMYIFQKKDLSHQQFKKYVKEISQNIEYNKYLLDNLLNWSSSQIKELKPKIELFEINSLIWEVIDNMKNILNRKEIQIEFKQEIPLIIKADISIVRLVLINLINNAIKFSERESKIFIQLNSSENKIEISVIDHGIGLQKSLDTLFQIHSVSTSCGTENEKGAGIGLMLCKEFLLKMGESIIAENNSDKGARFIFTLSKIV